VVRPLIAAAAAILLGAAGSAAPPDAAQWRPAPAYVGLFTPAYPPGAYAAYLSPEPLDGALRALAGDASLLRPPGAWVPATSSPRAALGAHGTHDRWALARLYGARHPRVARGPLGEAGRPTESWTLVSPYPDPTLTRLEPGTLLLVVRLP
jgi:hypothetical protein